MKVSVVISVCDGRDHLFEKSLDTWVNQSIPYKDFELVIVDDANRHYIRNLIYEYNKLGLQFQYIRVNKNLADVPITTFLPILTNNVGIRCSRGQVIVITGLETLQAEKNLEISYEFANRKECGYGLVFRSNIDFVDYTNHFWEELKPQPFACLLGIRGAQAECRTRPPHPPAYSYFVCCRKEYIEDIGGYDEDFNQGVFAEDDDYANRMKLSGITPVFEHRILGIHQDHSREDMKDENHNLRFTSEINILRKRNIELLNKNQKERKIIANQDHTWGDPKTIIEHGIL